MQEINISSSVTKIGKEAFSECINLKTVRFYNSLRDKISLNAINVCYNKAKVYEANAADKKLLCKIPRDLWGNIKSTDESAKKRDYVKSTERPVTIMSLVKEFLFKELTEERKVVEIATQAFSDCTNLKYLDTNGLILKYNGSLHDYDYMLFYCTPFMHKGKEICEAGIDLIFKGDKSVLSFHNKSLGELDIVHKCPKCRGLGRGSGKICVIMRGKYSA